MNSNRTPVLAAVAACVLAGACWLVGCAVHIHLMERTIVSARDANDTIDAEYVQQRVDALRERLGDESHD